MKRHLLASLSLLLPLVLQAWPPPAAPLGSAGGSLHAINGTHLFCRTLGQGEPILVVHGGPGMGHEFLVEPFTNLAKTHRVIFYDQRGCGRSDAFTEGEHATMDTMVEDLEGVRCAFGLPRLDLLGQSWGALVALSYARKHPDRVRTLMLVEPAPGSTAFFMQTIATMRSRIPLADRARLQEIEGRPGFEQDPAAYQEAMALRFKAYYRNPERYEPRQFAYYDRDRIAKQLASARMFNDYWSRYDVFDALKSLPCPLLLLRGDYDIVPMASFERMKALAPRVEAVVVKDCGHFVHVEQPAQYFGAIRSFLARNGAP